MENPDDNYCVSVWQRQSSGVILRIMALILLANFPALTTKAAPVSGAAQAALEETTLAYEEAQLVEETSHAEGIDPATTVEPDLPQPALEGIVDGAESATPRRLQYHVSLAVRSVYDDNVNLNQTNREGDLYTSIEPTIDLGWGTTDGNFVALTYAPNAFIFVDHSENNALQHVISLTGQYRFPLLTLSLSQDVQILDGTGLNTNTGTGTSFTRTNLDVAGRTKVNIYATRLNANYSLTGKTFLTGGLGYSVSDYETLISSSTLSANVYFNYTYSPKLSLGLGLSGGYNTVGSPSQNQTFEQINARASYELTGKISASVSGGVEFRQVENSGVQDNGSPVFDGSLFYQPFDGTSISMSFSRRTQNSATLFGQDFHSTTLTLSARQRFLQKIFFGLTVGYENSEYFSTISGLSSTRSDDYYFLQASLDYNITSFWTAGVFYFYRESQSTFSIFSFYDNQFGLRTSLTF
ncbi:MAG: outer membrane beta-barrel protein [Spartobacteria bacterium]